MKVFKFRGVFKRRFHGQKKAPHQSVAMVSKKNISLPVENPEVSARLTNMSMRSVGMRPDWIDIDHVSLPGRTRDCHRIFWELIDPKAMEHKHFVILHAADGVGKTTFLAQLYAMLEHAPESLLTLTPSKPHPYPFQTMRNILEQRFYISGKASFERIKRYVKGAVSAILANEDADAIGDAIVDLWRVGRNGEFRADPLPKDTASSDGPVLSLKPQSDGAGVQPPPLATKIVSIASILDAHRHEMDELPEAENAPSAPVVGTPPAAAPSSHSVRSVLNSAFLPLLAFFEADLRNNPMVIVIDDAEQYDAVSLELLAKLYEALPDMRFAVILTTANPKALPDILHDNAHMTYHTLGAMSDTDLSILVRYVMQTMAQSREQDGVSDDICRMIAHHAYGSPARAIEMTRQYFSPENRMHWPEALEKIRMQPLPKDIGRSVVSRFRKRTEEEKLLLQMASVFRAPFTPSALQCIADHVLEAPMDCASIFKRLKRARYFERTETESDNQRPTYLFRQNCERIIVGTTLEEGMKGRILPVAAQWFAMNDPDHRYDEIIGDLYHHAKRDAEACCYYERAAYSAQRQSQNVNAYALFRKLLGILKPEQVARRIRIALDCAQTALYIGRPDEAFRLCQQALDQATQYSAVLQAARANIQMANILIETGCLRHVMRYIKRARILLTYESDALLQIELNMALARVDILHHVPKRARQYLKKGRSLCDQTTPQSILMMLTYLETLLDVEYDKPLRHLPHLEALARQASEHGAMRLCAMIHESAGNIYYRVGNLSAALDAWNSALGLAQEMGDMILNSTLLADIAEGAIALKALRTARAALEQCLVMTQQTRQKDVIARCFASTAQLQMMNGNYEHAMRMLRKAHKTASSLRLMPIWTYSLSLYARIAQMPKSPYYNPSAAIRIYQNLGNVFRRYQTPLLQGSILPPFADVLTQTQQKSAALHVWRMARKIYSGLELERAVEKIQAKIDAFSDENRPTPS